MMCVYYLCAAGMNVLVGYAGQKSLGQAGLFAAGAYAVALLTTRTEIDPWLALVARGRDRPRLCGVLIALPSLRVKGPYLAMVTLAFGIVVEKLVGEWTEVFGGAQGIYGIKPLTWNGQPFTSAAMGVVRHRAVRRHAPAAAQPAARPLRSRAALAAGGRDRRRRRWACASIAPRSWPSSIAAVTCGIAGALVAQQNQYINSDFITFHLSIFILLLVLFGGAGSMYGPLVGAVLLTLIDALLARWPSVQHFLYGFLLLFALYVMPGGVVGLFAQVVRKRPKPRRARRRGRASRLTRIGPRRRRGELLDVRRCQQELRRRASRRRTCRSGCSAGTSMR